jgi:hypothetical protein
MTLDESLAVFFAELGVSATAGSTTANGIFDQPSQVLAGDMVLTTDYTFTAAASDFGTLTAGSSITVDSVAYTVREARLIDDGAIVELSLQKT